MNKTGDSKKCTKLRSACCDCIREGSFNTFKTKGDTFYLKEDMTCRRSNLLYAVICFKCNKVHLRDRRWENKVSRESSTLTITYSSTTISNKQTNKKNQELVQYKKEALKNK